MHTPTLKPAALLALAALSFASHAGPLDPPAGPVQPTMKTLTEVEPRTLINAQNTPTDGNNYFVISTPGSYYLGQSYTVDGYNAIIKVTSPDVVIDLNGFTLDGNDTTNTGVSGNNAAKNLTVRNGNLRDFAYTGIFGFYTTGTIVDSVIVTNTANRGIDLGTNSRVTNTTVVNATYAGIGTGEGSIVRDSIANDSTNGFDAYGATSYFNCSARENSYAGFYLVGGCSLLNSVAADNTGTAINSDPDTSGITVADCTVSVPNVPGVSGIVIPNRSTLRNNNVTSANSTGYCIVATGQGNRIEGNSTFGGYNSIHAVSGTKNLVIRNFHVGVSSNPFQISSSNMEGPEVSALTEITTTNPYTNFHAE